MTLNDTMVGIIRMYGKKITRNQIIGFEGEDEVKTWLSKYCHITANKLERDFGIDFIGQWRGNPVNESRFSYYVNPMPISIAVRATTSTKGKIKIDQADAKVLLETPCVFLVIPHSFSKGCEFYAKFIDPKFINELNVFIAGQKKVKILGVDNCISDISEINKQIELLLSPAHIESIKQYKIRLGLQCITPTGKIEIHHSDGGSYAFITTKEFSEFFTEGDNKLKQDIVWGGLKYRTRHMSEFNASRQLKKDFIEYLHSLPVKNAILFGINEMFQDGGLVRCKVHSAIDKTEAFCDFHLRCSDEWKGLWHPIGFAIKVKETKMPDGTGVYNIESYMDPKVTFSDILADKELCNFLRYCRDIDSTFIWSGYEIQIRLLPDFRNAGMFVFLYEESLTYNANLIPIETKLNQVTDEDLCGLSLLYVFKDITCIGKLEIKFTADTVCEVPIYNIEAPLCFNILGRGVICWMKRTGCLLLNEEGVYVGIKLGETTSVYIEQRVSSFAQCDFPFIGIRKDWPVIKMCEDGHAKLQRYPITENLQMKFTFEP